MARGVEYLQLRPSLCGGGQCLGEFQRHDAVVAAMHHQRRKIELPHSEHGFVSVLDQPFRRQIGIVVLGQRRHAVETGFQQ